MTLSTDVHLVPWLRMSGAIPPLAPCALMEQTGKTLPFIICTQYNFNFMRKSSGVFSQQDGKRPHCGPVLGNPLFFCLNHEEEKLQDLTCGICRIKLCTFFKKVTFHGLRADRVCRSVQPWPWYQWLSLCHDGFSGNLGLKFTL